MALSVTAAQPRDRAEPLLSCVRVSNAVAHFAQSLPFRVRCSNDLAIGLTWASRKTALRHREIAPDPPEWKTALRFDIDCPCDRQPHARAGYCPRAATYWRDAAAAEPSFVVINPANGHAHYVYLLRGWIRVDGADPSQLAAVRYYAAIERAYTRALRADAGYAGLVQHNPFSGLYETHNGRDEPYSLSELAAYVELPRFVPRGKTEIRTDGRNIETFDRLRHWAYALIGEYRCGPRATWDEVVAARALTIAAEVRAAHPLASHAFSDHEALTTAKSVAGWVWSRYDGGSLTRVRADNAARRAADRKRALEARRERGSVPREEYLAAVQRRREEASRLRGLGVAIEEIASRLQAGVRSVHRWLAEIRCVPRPSATSDFEGPREGTPRQASLIVETSLVDSTCLSSVSGAHGASVEDRCEYAPPVHSVELVTQSATLTGNPSVSDRGGRLAYIQRRIAELIVRARGGAQPP